MIINCQETLNNEIDSGLLTIKANDRIILINDKYVLRIFLVYINNKACI